MEALPEAQSAESVAEIVRLALARLGQLGVPASAINYALIYSYYAGEDIELNARLDEIFESGESWSEQEAGELYKKYICRCGIDSNQAMERDLLTMTAQILEMVVDLSGRTTTSSESLEQHLSKLEGNTDPGVILSVASEIIAETRSFVDETRGIEQSLRNSTKEIELLKDELDNVRRQATVDALTGLNNRRGFDRALNRAVKAVKSGEQSFSLMMIDIDFFKKVNDNHGHLVGDKVLIGVARQFQRQMRGNDYLSRYGGEEFAILLLETPITGAFTVAENLRKSIERLRLRHTKTGKHIGKVTISVGVACCRTDESPQELIQRCDKALYRAKSLGRNRTILAE